MRSALCRVVPRRGGKLVLAGLALALAVLALPQDAAAQQDMAFGLGNAYNGVPGTFRGVAQDPNKIVIYDLPATGRYAAQAGVADGHVDVFARIQGNTQRQVAVYGVIASLPAGSTGVRFMAGAIDPQNPNPPNNLPTVRNPTRTQNAGLSAVIGDLNVEGQPAGDLSIGIGGIAPPPATDVPVNPNDGLVAIPIDVDPGLTDPNTMIAERAITFSLDAEFSGFANTALQLLTNTAAFPHQAATLQIRRSRPGDANGDGFVNNLDISGFVAAILNRDNFQNANPWIRAAYVTDINSDSFTNNLDINPFVQAIIAGSPEPAAAGSPSAIPEPSTWALGALCVVGTLIARRRLRQR